MVAPKRQSLNAAESVFDEYMTRLQVKQAELKVVTDKLQKLNDDLDAKQKEKKVIICFSILTWFVLPEKKTFIVISFAWEQLKTDPVNICII